MKKLVLAFAVLLLGSAAWAGPVQERNKAVARRVFEEIFSQGKFEVASETYAADFVNHGVHSTVALKEDQEAMRGWRSAFPDGKMAIIMTVAEDDLVTVVWMATGTNTGQGNGLPATGKKIELRGITVWRILDGKIREEWSSFDRMHLMQQLGLLPESKS
jgi:steroid delta-isomerase-like uncharacterized protein